MEKSIAVLPFQSLSEDKANAYFAEGIQDEILTRLAKIADLKVISRTSSQKYKSASSNLREIAQQLGVAHILEGSVQKAADQVRISVQLVNALNDSHIWAETYDRKLIDVFQVESDVAQKIAASLEAKLTGREKQDIAVAGTKNPEAYDAFLHALSLRNKQSVESGEEAIGFSRRAVELDPNFAEAWAVLALITSPAHDSISTILTALVPAMLAYNGFQMLGPLGGEVANPKRNIPTGDHNWIVSGDCPLCAHQFDVPPRPRIHASSAIAVRRFRHLSVTDRANWSPVDHSDHDRFCIRGAPCEFPVEPQDYHLRWLATVISSRLPNESIQCSTVPVAPSSFKVVLSRFCWC